MMPQRWFVVAAFVTLLLLLTAPCPAATPTPRPEGTLTVAVATFGNERWLPELYPGAEDVKSTFAIIAKEGSANGLAPEFRRITSMEIEDPSTLTIRFAKPFVTFGNRVTQGLFASSAFIHSKKYRDTVGD